MSKALGRRFLTVTGIATFLELLSLLSVASIGGLQGSRAATLAFAIVPLSAIWGLKPPAENIWLKLAILTGLSIGLPLSLGWAIKTLQYS